MKTKKRQVSCKYCGELEFYEFIPSSDTPTFQDALDNDLEYICRQCGSPVRLNEALMTKYSLKKDHANIKAQIKSWEKIIDKIIRLHGNDLNDLYINQRGGSVTEILEDMSHEMLTINL